MAGSGTGENLELEYGKRQQEQSVQSCKNPEDPQLPVIRQATRPDLGSD